MKAQYSLLITLAAGATLGSEPALAQGARTGPGAMRCTVVIGRLTSQDSTKHMTVLSWVQGYLSGVAASRSAGNGASFVEVPEYDELQPRILTLCKADPRADLYHVADRVLLLASRDR